MKRQIITIVSILSIAVVGCVSATDPNKKAKQGAAVGAATGAAVGAVVGHQSDDRDTGAVVGAVVGAGVGALIGHRMDKQQAELERVEGLEVERIAEDEIAVTINNDILYDVDSWMLRPASRTTLDEMAGVFTRYTDTTIQLSGHADSTGSEEHNQGLSVRRAEAVGSYLAMQGVARSRIETTGYGETFPRESNETSSGRQLNRRVEIKIKAEPQ